MNLAYKDKSSIIKQNLIDILPTLLVKHFSISLTISGSIYLYPGDLVVEIYLSIVKVFVQRFVFLVV